MKLQVNNIGLKTWQKRILEGVTFSFDLRQKNAIYATNSQGKKALLLILGGYLKPSSGSVLLDGQAAEKSDFGVGEIDKINPLLEQMTVRENLIFCAKLRGVNDGQKFAEEKIKLFNLEIWADTKVEEIMPLQRAFLSVACACAGNPKYILLNEPTACLTSSEATEFWKIINNNLNEKIIIFTTKNDNEAKMGADVCVCLDGKNTYIEKI